MAIHHCIIADFLNAKNDPAFFDVVAPPTSDSVRYVVYQPATGNRFATVPFTNQFATSADLFNLGGSPIALPALVSAETLDPAGAPDGANSSAVLRQRKLITFAPRNNQAFATSFLVPVGDLGSTSGGGSGANLLLANPAGQPESVDYTVNGVPQPNVSLDRGECRAIRINTAPAIVGIRSSDNLIVALAIVGKGQDFAMTLIEHV